MSRLERFESMMRISVIPMLGASAILIHNYFEHILETHPAWSLTITVFFLAGLIALVERAIEKLKCVRWIRKHLILRDDWIEGVWFDFLIDEEATTFFGNGIITIEFVDGELKISGAGVSSAGVEIAPFAATLIDWKKDGVRFVYEKDGGVTIGLAQYDFRRYGSGKRTGYSGWFLETNELKRQNVVAFLVDKPDLLSELGDSCRRHAAIHKLITMYKKLAVIGDGASSVQ
jgi:hypothetical protein